MKKIYALALLLALVAVLAVPMAASANTVISNVTVGGNITNGTIAMAAPGAIAFGTLSSVTPNEKNAAPGTVTVTPGSSGTTTWTATAAALANPPSTGYMTMGGTKLANPVFIGKSIAEGMLVNAATGSLAYSGSASGPITFAAKQTLTPGTDNVGIYSITFTFTASFTG